MLSLAEQLLFFYPLKRHCNMPDFRVRIFKYVELSSSLLNGNQKKKKSYVLRAYMFLLPVL